LWEAVQKWLMAPSHPERRGNTASPLLVSILPLIKFPFMTADELTMVERSPLVESHPKLFHPQILLAYKFQALPLASRASCKEFAGPQFILRNYTDVRWDRRITVRADDLRRENGYDRGIDQAYNVRISRHLAFTVQKIPFAWNASCWHLMSVLDAHKAK
uniref:Glyco_transf_64 domain-containing protein n=1 Tax=Gongylonema pulchrum TaxID=637853 RepID=A0A183EIA5_9BILA